MRCIYLHIFFLFFFSIRTHCQIVFQMNKPKWKKPIPRLCPLCLADGVTKKYKRVTDHVRHAHQITGIALRVIMSAERAKSGKSRNKKRHYYRCPSCDVCVLDRTQHLVQAHKMDTGTESFLKLRSEFKKLSAKLYACNFYLYLNFV